MKKPAIVILLFTLIFTVIGSAYAVPANQTLPDTIRVTGNGTAFAAPDIAYVMGGVEVLNADVSTAVNEANANLEAIRAALSEFGVAESDIRTEYFNIYRDGGFDPNFPANFRVNHSLRITVRDTSVVPQVLSAILNAGANRIDGVNYDVADTAAIKSEARAAALEDAQRIAEELAGFAGVTLGEVVAITEYPTGGTTIYYSNAGFGGGGGGGIGVPPVNGGNLAIGVSVEVTYAIAK